MGKKDGEIKGELYFRRIIETSGENKEFEKFRFIALLGGKQMHKRKLGKRWTNR